ncbi:MAG: ABC transporter ATP-binding protein, partial [Candidatus Neomarinimicrobiota bacterium]
MTDFSIKVQNVSKEYNLGTISSGTLSQDITKIFYKYTGLEDPNKKIFRDNVLDEKDSSGRIIALKNISFRVNEGEIIGVIGKNGAGKSTLLKILSRITSPTLGSIEIKGRLSSLLEVGTGFHPELTGMENIYLNGSIMGMTKIEIDNSLSQIIKFSGIKKFIDTPVKRYSTGMRVRLGFSVAAHLNPEILLIDEVLAVGDAEFQKKCLGKIKDISSIGRTVLFVSHNLSAIRTICDRAILLDKGNLVYDGLTKDTLKFYRKEILKPFSSSVKYDQFQNDITLKEISISKKEIISGDSFTFNFCFENNNNKDAASGITFHLVDEYDNLVFVGGSSN